MSELPQIPSQPEDAAGELTRRGFLQKLSAASLLALGASGLVSQGALAATPLPNLPRLQSTPLKAAFSNAGLGATWCAQGKEAAEQWGKWFNVEVTWFDGGLSVDKQRKAIEDMATQKWDFVAIQPF